MMKPIYSRFTWAIILAAVLSVVLGPASHAKLTDPQKLVSFLNIELPGWKVKEGYPKSVRVQEKGQSYVEAQAFFTSGKSTLIAVVMEGEVSEEVAKVRKFPVANNEKGYCQKTTIQGFEAVEIYEKMKKSAFLFIVLGDNCIIPMEGKEVESTKDLKALANKIDLRRLAALVK